MGKCAKVQRKQRRICAGDLNTLIEIQSRDSKPINNRPQVFFTTHSTPWALWETTGGVQKFDGTNTAELSSEIQTDICYIRYDATITKEYFVLLDNKRFRILDVENLDRRDEWLLLRLTERGDKDLGANFG